MMSAKLMPLALTRMRTSPARGDGSGASRSSSTSGGPTRVIHTCRIDAAPRFPFFNTLLGEWTSHPACERRRAPWRHAPRAPKDARRPLERISGQRRDYLSLIAAWTFAATSAGMVVSPCAVFACSAPFVMTSAISFPSMTTLQPGIKSPQFRIFAMIGLLVMKLRDADSYLIGFQHGQTVSLHGGSRAGIIGARPATARTLPGDANQIAVIEIRLHAMAMPN